MERKPARTRRSFSDKFKRDAVAMVLNDGDRIVDVARRLGIREGTLRSWVAQARTNRGERGGLTTSEKAELAEQVAAIVGQRIRVLLRVDERLRTLEEQRAALDAELDELRPQRRIKRRRPDLRLV